MVEAQVCMSSVQLFVLLGRGPSIYHQDVRLIGPSWLRVFGHKPYLRALTLWPVFFAYFCVPVVASDCITGFVGYLSYFVYCCLAWFSKGRMYCQGFAVYHLIGCEASSLHLCCIVGVFSQWYQFWPVILLVIGVFAQILL